MKNILITGSNGQLGSELRMISSEFSDFKFYLTDVDDLDICNIDAINDFVKENQIDFVVNCAAYTAVDKAEADVELCFKINSDAVANLGKVVAANGIKIVHVSTDYVFDGCSCVPYVEDDTVSPSSVYGKSKLSGERMLFEYCPQAVIVRTSWLYSSFGANFVKTMLRLGKERDSLNVIFDQIGTPTYAADLARAIMSIIQQDCCFPGVYHFSNEGVCSWFDFTKAIHEIAGVECKVYPIESKDYPVSTPRPFYSVLNKSKIKSQYKIDISYWRDSLKRCMEVLLKEL